MWLTCLWSHNPTDLFLNGTDHVNGRKGLVYDFGTITWKISVLESCNQSALVWHKITGRESRTYRSVWMYQVCVNLKAIYSHLCIWEAWDKLYLSSQNSQEPTLPLGHDLSAFKHYSVMHSMFKTQYNMENYEGASSHFFLFFGTIDL